VHICLACKEKRERRGTMQTRNICIEGKLRHWNITIPLVDLTFGLLPKNFFGRFNPVLG
jgi:hypothetical protein